MKARLLLALVLIGGMAVSAAAQEPTDTLAANPPENAPKVGEGKVVTFSAQPSTPQGPAGSTDGWRVTWAPSYLWFSGFSGTVGAGGRTASVDAGFWDLASHLNFAWSTMLDVGKGRFGVVTDLQYIHLEDDHTFSGPPPPLFSGVNANSKLFVLDPEFYVRAVDTDRGSFDFLGGFRYWHLKNDIEFRPGVLSGVNVSASDNWVDPIIGLRFRINLDQDKKWFLPAKADIGGFDAGSNYTWQVFGGIGRKLKLFGHSSAIIVGYRKLFVDRTSDGKLMKVSLSGPIFGTTISFGQH